MAQTSYILSLPGEDRERYLKKLLDTGIQRCPFEMVENWINDPTQWPNIDYSDIYHYLVESPSLYTSETMKNKRSLEAHNFFISGWVEAVLHIKTDKCFIFKSRVKPSWRVTNKPHNTWVAVENSGKVSAAHCDCMAGLGESCSHVGAVLYKLEASVRLGITTTVSTSIACQWNAVTTKKVEPAEIRSIDFGGRGKTVTGKVKRPIPKASASQQATFLQMLQETGECPVVLSTFSQYAGSTPNHSSWFKTLAFTKEEADRVEAETVMQAACKAWRRHRVGRITSSLAHTVLHTNHEKPSNTVIKTIMSEAKDVNSPYLKWGRDNEKNALETYKYALGIGPATGQLSTNILVTEDVRKVHEGLRVDRAGFRISHERPYFGVSCDAYVSCECCGKGVVEAKCPYKWAGQSVSWTDDAKGHLSTLFSLKRNHAYYTQVQLQMFVCAAQYADFVTWTPKQTTIFRILKDDEFIHGMVDIISRFWAKHIHPRLMTVLQSETGPDSEGVDRQGCESDLSAHQSPAL